jgi:hypothetical protein
MFLIPPLFGFIFVLLLAYKLLGGGISWIIVWIFGGLFVIPLIIFILMWISYSAKNKKTK